MGSHGRVLLPVELTGRKFLLPQSNTFEAYKHALKVTIISIEHSFTIGGPVLMIHFSGHTNHMGSLSAMQAWILIFRPTESKSPWVGSGIWHFQ